MAEKFTPTQTTEQPEQLTEFTLGENIDAILNQFANENISLLKILNAFEAQWVSKEKNFTDQNKIKILDKLLELFKTNNVNQMQIITVCILITKSIQNEDEKKRYALKIQTNPFQQCNTEDNRKDLKEILATISLEEDK